jgi:outer membrane protein assembly factor BamB
MVRLHLRQSVAAGTLALSIACPAFAASNPEAVTYRTNPAHTAQATMPDFSLPLEKKWDIDLGVNATYPLIAGGKVFVVLTAGSSANGSYNSLMAFDAVTGRAAWGPVALPASTSRRAEICYENGRVFMNIGGRGSSSGGLMSAYSAANGALLWSATLPNQDEFSSAPTALNGFVYTLGYGYGATIYCLRETDGKIMWTGNVNSGDDSAPTLDAANLYEGFGCGESYKFDALTGSQVWRLQTGCYGGGGATSAYYNNLVFIRHYHDSLSTPYPGPAAALDSSTGNVIKTFPNQGAMAFDNNMVFSVVNNALTAMKIGAWTTAWTVNSGSDVPVTAPTIVNGVAYVGATNGKLLGFDENTGRLVVKLDLGRQALPTTESQIDMAAGDGILVIPAGTHLIAIGSQLTLESVKANSAVVIGGANIGVTVTLTNPAPTGGSKINLSSSDTRVKVPAAVTVPAGALSASFFAQTARTNIAAHASLTASFNGVTIATPVTLLPDGLASLTLSPSTAVHGRSSIGTVTLAYPAPAGGVLIRLASAFAPLARPSAPQLVIPAGQSTGTFTILTGKSLASVPVNIAASADNSNTLLKAITIAP